MLHKNLFLLASAGFLILAPMVNLLGMETKVEEQKVTTVKGSVSDEDVTRAVKDAFANDTNFVKFTPTVKVSTVNGVVTLAGTVDSQKAKSDLEAKARSVTGVTSVVNNLEVKVVK